MKPITYSLTGIALIVLLSACGAAPQSGGMRNSAPQPAARGAFDQEETKADIAPRAEADKNAPVQATQRLIIKNATLTLIVTDVAAQIELINTIAKDNGGYIVSQSTSKQNAYVSGNVNLRVDSAKLDAVLAQLRASSIEVRNENVTGDDVTAEFIDLESNLKNLEAAEAQLKKIMDGATKTEDVLAVFEQMTTLRGQIDTIKGRMKFLNQSAALSSITLELIPDAASKPVEASPWRPGGTVNVATETLIRALQGLVDISIFFVIAVLPVLALMALPIVLLIVVLRKRSQRRKRASTPAPTLPPTA